MSPRFASLLEARQWILNHGRGRVLQVLILHDNRCTSSATTPCNCSPEFEVQDLTAEGYVEGERQQRQWFQGHRWN